MSVNRCKICNGFRTIKLCLSSLKWWQFRPTIKCSACDGDGIAKPPGWPDSVQSSLPVTQQVTELLTDSFDGRQRKFLIVGLENDKTALDQDGIPKLGDENPYTKRDPPMKCVKVVAEPIRGRLIKIYVSYE